MIILFLKVVPPFFNHYLRNNLYGDLHRGRNLCHGVQRDVPARCRILYSAKRRFLAVRDLPPVDVRNLNIALDGHHLLALVGTLSPGRETQQRQEQSKKVKLPKKDAIISNLFPLIISTIKETK